MKKEKFLFGFVRAPLRSAKPNHTTHPKLSLCSGLKLRFRLPALRASFSPQRKLYYLNIFISPFPHPHIKFAP